MSGAKAFFGRVWGSDGSRGFKLAAWATAVAGVGAWTYLDNKGKSGVMGADEIEKLRSDRNNKILADQKKKSEQ